MSRSFQFTLALALSTDYPLFYFPRATSALDAASESLVNKTISEITASHSLTTVLIAHR